MHKIFIVTILIVFLTIGLAKGGFLKSQPNSSISDSIVEKALASENYQYNGQGDKEKPSQEFTFFSWPTIVSLILAAFGIVPCRRNTYS